MFDTLENPYGKIKVQTAPSFSAICAVGKLPFYASANVEFVAKDKLLEFESFEAWLKTLGSEKLTIESACRLIFDALRENLAPLYLKVEVQGYTPVHAAATAALEMTYGDIE